MVKDLVYGAIGIILMAALPLSWITHIVTCIETEKWGFLIAGAIMFPVAIIHGIMIWLGLA